MGALAMVCNCLCCLWILPPLVDSIYGQCDSLVVHPKRRQTSLNPVNKWSMGAERWIAVRRSSGLGVVAVDLYPQCAGLGVVTVDSCPSGAVVCGK